MATVQMVMQGKGGVGKSFVSAAMAQYILDQDGVAAPLCIDTDPVNKTLSGYKAFNTQSIDLLEGSTIRPRRFDTLTDMICGASDDQQIVVDNGASSFLPLAEYMFSSGFPDALASEGHTLYLHSIVTGGQGQNDTLEGLTSLLTAFPTVPVVVWLNPFLGPIEYRGKGFEDLKLYKTFRERISAIISIPDVHPDLAGHDLAELLKSRRTFSEGVADPHLGIMVRQRLVMMKRALYAQIQSSNVFAALPAASVAS